MEEEKSVYEGRVKSVMETWPLQLTLEVDDREIEAILSPEVRIRSEELALEGVAAPQPAPGMVIRIEGMKPDAGRRLRVESVEIKELAPAAAPPSAADSKSAESESSAESAPMESPPPASPSSANVPMPPPSAD